MQTETNRGRHTPGPWIAYNSDNGRILKHWRIRGGAVRNDPTFAVVDSGGRIAPEYEAANARLIAAAPELLEALRWVLEDHDADDANPDRTARVIAAARAAIRKAEGGAE